MTLIPFSSRTTLIASRMLMSVSFELILPTPHHCYSFSARIEVPARGAWSAWRVKSLSMAQLRRISIMVQYQSRKQTQKSAHHPACTASEAKASQPFFQSALFFAIGLK
jgi:hypothetical protein